MKAVSRLFNHNPTAHINVSNNGEFPIAEVASDKLVDQVKKTCHASYGGNWDISVYEKPTGERYNKTVVNCMKCNMMRGNLYSSPKTPKENSLKYKNFPGCVRKSGSRKKMQQRDVHQLSQLPSLSKYKKSSQSKKEATPQSAPVINVSRAKDSAYRKCGMYYGLGGSPVKIPSPENKKQTYTSPVYSSDSSPDSSPTNASFQKSYSQISFKTEKKRRSGTNFYKTR